MKNDERTKKFLNNMSGALQKAADIGKKAVDNVQKSAKELSEKQKNDNYERRMKKYNPLFPETFNSPDFSFPNVIAIVDKAVRKDVDVCEGAIGWTSVEMDQEVLYLHKEEAEESCIQFFPHASCNTVYYVDNFNKNLYIRVDCIFRRAHDERLAELKYIAHALGAKRCSIEMQEKRADKKSSRININAVISRASGANSSSCSSARSDSRRGRIVAEFEGNDTPQRPQLKWFANDENIKRLIEMRCTNCNSIKSEVLELEGASSNTMSQEQGAAIDFAISNVGFKLGYSMEQEAEGEKHSLLIYSVEF